MFVIISGCGHSILARIVCSRLSKRLSTGVFAFIASRFLSGQGYAFSTVGGQPFGDGPIDMMI